MSKYYTLTSKSPAYAAAVVLHPAHKWEYLEKSWESDWMPPTRAAVEKLWNDEYRPKASPLTQNAHQNSLNIDPQISSSSTLSRSKVSGRQPNLFTQFLSSKRSER